MSSRTKAISRLPRRKESSKFKSGRQVRAFPEKLEDLAAAPDEHASIRHVVGMRGPAKQLLKELPFSYNKTQLILLVRDPTWAYAYWDFSGDTWSWIQDLLCQDPNARTKLRVYDLDHRLDYDLDVDLEAKNWYLDLGSPDTTFEAELGLLDSKGKFHVIAKSNQIRTPRIAPSQNIDQAWEAEDFEEIYRLSGGGQRGTASSFSVSSDFQKKR